MPSTSAAAARSCEPFCQRAGPELDEADARQACTAVVGTVGGAPAPAAGRAETIGAAAGSPGGRQSAVSPTPWSRAWREAGPKDRPPQLTEASREGCWSSCWPSWPRQRGRLVALAASLGNKGSGQVRRRGRGILLAQVRNEKETDANRIQAAAQLIDFRKGDAEAARRTARPAHAAHLAGAGPGACSTPWPAARPRQPGRPWSNACRHPDAGRDGVGHPRLAQPARTGRTPCSTRSTRARCQLADLSLDQKQALAAHPTRPSPHGPGSCSRAAAACPTPTGRRCIDELLPLTKKTGDAAAGKAGLQEPLRQVPHAHRRGDARSAPT